MTWKMLWLGLWRKCGAALIAVTKADSWQAGAGKKRLTSLKCSFFK